MFLSVLKSTGGAPNGLIDKLGLMFGIVGVETTGAEVGAGLFTDVPKLLNPCCAC